METMTEALYLSMLLIWAGSFFFGILPMSFSFRITRSYPFVLSLILCLGAGVLMATSLIHMLTEVQTKLKFNAQLYFCGGLLMLYVFDEISHFCIDARKLEIGSTVAERERIRSRSRSDYGATHDSPSVSRNSSYPETNDSKQGETFQGEKSCYSQFRRNVERQKRETQQSLLEDNLHSGNNDQWQVVHNSSEDQWATSAAAKTGLLVALLVHSILEGISIGVQTNISQVLLILGAVTFHKIVLSFCLGLELHNHGFQTVPLLLSIFLFSIGSPIGITIGMTVISLEKGILDVSTQLQAIAAGSLLYVAVFEVLPRERYKWQHGNQKGAGIFQLISLILGFTCITIFHFYLDPPHANEHPGNVTEKKGKNAVQARIKLTDVYGESVLTVRQCQNWFAKFRSGNFDVEDAPPSGRPVEADKDAIKALVDANQKRC